MTAGPGPGGPTLPDVRREFPGWTVAASPRRAGGCVAVRLCPASDPVPERYSAAEGDSPADLRQRIVAAERAIAEYREHPPLSPEARQIQAS